MTVWYAKGDLNGITRVHYPRIDVAEMEGDLLKAILSKNLGKIEAKYIKLIEAQMTLNEMASKQMALHVD